MNSLNLFRRLRIIVLLWFIMAFIKVFNITDSKFPTHGCFFLFLLLPIFERLFSFSTLQQLGADPQHWAEVYAILKGTSLSCYHRQQDVEASIEPAFTIAISKVGT